MPRLVATLATLALLSGAAPLAAQDIFVPPVTTADPGYLFPNDQYQREQDGAVATQRQQNQQGAEIAFDDAAKARIRAAMEALVPEYNARLQRDGETSANEWIRQKAFELGQREADIMKERLGLN